MELTFDQQVGLSVLSDLLFATAIVGTAAVFDRRLQARKARDEALRELSGKRVDAFEILWKHIAVVRRDEPLSEEAKTKLNNDLYSWYYQEAGAMYLTWPAANQLFIAWDTIWSDEKCRGQVVDAFSRLRTELKIDTGIYKVGERHEQLYQRTNVRPPSAPLEPTTPRDTPARRTRTKS